MLMIRCDCHTRFQQIPMLDTASGEIIDRRLEHKTGQGVLRRTPKSGSCRDGSYGCPPVAGRISGNHCDGHEPRATVTARWFIAKRRRRC